MCYFGFVKRCFFLCVIMASSIQLMAQSNAVEWIHLSTLWDAPGTIMEVSPNGDYAVIKHNDISRLVEIVSGEIILEVANGYIEFSTQGQYIRYSQYSYEPPYTSNILNLKTLSSYQIEVDSVQFMTDEKHMITTKYDDDRINGWSQIRNIDTGEILTEYYGVLNRLSRNMNLAILHINEATRRVARVVDLTSSEVVAEYTYPMADYVYSFSSAFNADDSLVAIYFPPEEMQIIDTSTWEVLYTLSGGITFSRDGKYIAHNNHAGYSDVQLIEAHTGQVLDEFLGSIHFSNDGRYIIRGEAIDYDHKDWKIIDLATREEVFHPTDYRGYPKIFDNNILAMYDTITPSTRIFDLYTGNLISEISGFIEYIGEYIVVDDLYTPFTHVKDLNGLTIYATGRQIEMIPEKGLALVSNGFFVDVYGLVETKFEGIQQARESRHHMG